ncbi:hypothetical protein HPB50_005683 [Hyalomma asiaticum]|uniref:Uncharacterized protein n=1 Tax=Hyalomma asiaticum TaxID=266040 RepID=A0ACB7S0J3_HYAAI|nr:hypothetical protein HPB50_005683 [Hyalomma asiaticum]
MNLALWFLGLLMMVIGLSLYVSTIGGEEEEEADVLSTIDRTSTIFTRVEIIVLIVGTSLFIVSFCGCVGALRENRFLLQLYSLALTAMIAANLVLGVVVFYIPGGIRKVVQKTLSESLIVNYRDSVETEHLVDALQRGMKCCGVSSNNFRDWNNNMYDHSTIHYFNCTHLNPSFERCAVPYSCCKRNRSSVSSGSVATSLYCGQGVLNMSDRDAWHKVHVESCTDAVNRYIKENVIMIGGGSLAVVILLSFIDMITNTVIDEIDVIRTFYDNIQAAAAPSRQGQHS